MTRPHGYARYRLDGCRCYVCGWARSQYDDNRTRALIAGTWQPWVDAEPVRTHIRYLQSCDMGLRTIAARAGVDRKRLQAVLHGRPERGTPAQKKLRPAPAAAILEVEPTLDNLAGKTVINAVGTVRRLRALVAVGWPQQHVAEAMGWTPSNFGQLLRSESVIVRTARLVQDVYDRLHRTDPAKHSATPLGMERARQRAAALGWAPVGAWDDETIDDPEAFPDWTGNCGTPEGFWAHRSLAAPACQPCRDAFNADQRARRAPSAVRQQHPPLQKGPS
ncbi:hypothetical protein ACF06P_35565 [Streptomyces sp. NPDC015684]|uniref:hypothetical protein n=1 Tax=Streptomyces sp. NPDC015684 TaxID=3364963 RepID=UPI0037025147